MQKTKEYQEHDQDDSEVGGEFDDGAGLRTEVSNLLEETTIIESRIRDTLALTPEELQNADLRSFDNFYTYKADQLALSGIEASQEVLDAVIAELFAELEETPLVERENLEELEKPESPELSELKDQIRSRLEITDKDLNRQSLADFEKFAKTKRGTIADLNTKYLSPDEQENLRAFVDLQLHMLHETFLPQEEVRRKENVLAAKNFIDRATTLRPSDVENEKFEDFHAFEGAMQLRLTDLNYRNLSREKTEGYIAHRMREMHQEWQNSHQARKEQLALEAEKKSEKETREKEVEEAEVKRKAEEEKEAERKAELKRKEKEEKIKEAEAKRKAEEERQAEQTLMSESQEPSEDLSVFGIDVAYFQQHLGPQEYKRVVRELAELRQKPSITALLKNNEKRIMPFLFGWVAALRPDELKEHKNTLSTQIMTAPEVAEWLDTQTITSEVQTKLELTSPRAWQAWRENMEHLPARPRRKVAEDKPVVTKEDSAQEATQEKSEKPKTPERKKKTVEKEAPVPSEVVPEKSEKTSALEPEMIAEEKSPAKPQEIKAVQEALAKAPAAEPMVEAKHEKPTPEAEATMPVEPSMEQKPEEALSESAVEAPIEIPEEKAEEEVPAISEPQPEIRAEEKVAETQPTEKIAEAPALDVVEPSKPVSAETIAEPITVEPPAESLTPELAENIPEEAHTEQPETIASKAEEKAETAEFFDIPEETAQSEEPIAEVLEPELLIPEEEEATMPEGTTLADEANSEEMIEDASVEKEAVIDTDFSIEDFVEPEEAETVHEFSAEAFTELSIEKPAEADPEMAEEELTELNIETPLEPEESEDAISEEDQADATFTELNLEEEEEPTAEDIFSGLNLEVPVTETPAPVEAFVEKVEEPLPLEIENPAESEADTPPLEGLTELVAETEVVFEAREIGIKTPSENPEEPKLVTPELPLEIGKSTPENTLPLEFTAESATAETVTLEQKPAIETPEVRETPKAEEEQTGYETLEAEEEITFEAEKKDDETEEEPAEENVAFLSLAEYISSRRKQSRITEEQTPQARFFFQKEHEKEEKTSLERERKTATNQSEQYSQERFTLAQIFSHFAQSTRLSTGKDITLLQTLPAETLSQIVQNPKALLDTLQGYFQPVNDISHYTFHFAPSSQPMQNNMLPFRFLIRTEKGTQEHDLLHPLLAERSSVLTA